MYQVQSDKLKYFEQEINNPNRKITYRFTLRDEQLSSTLVMDNPVLTTDTGLDQYGVGCSLITQLQLSIKSEVLLFLKDKITIEVGLDIYNEETQQWETIYTPLGVYYVDDIEQQGATKSIKAYDGMYKLNKGYFPSAKHTNTQAIANDIANANGYKVKGMSNVTINNEQLEGKTCLEMLSLLASAIGGHVRISRDGSTIEFIEPTNYGLVFDESDYTNPTLNDSVSYDVQKLTVIYSERVTNDEGVVTDEGSYEVGNGIDAQTLSISNPLLKGQQTQATNVLNKIKKLNGYKRFDTTLLLADFRIDSMDMITFTKGENEYIVPILYSKMTLTYQGVSIEVQSPTLAETKSEFNFKGTLSQKVENIYTDLIQVKELTANKVTTDELEATVATIEKLYATKAEIGELVAGSIVVEDLKAQIAEIDKAIINKADITDLNALRATIENLKVEVAEIDNLIAGSILADIIQAGSISSDLLNVRDGFIKDAMISSLSASKINSGVINTNNVTIQSDNGNMLLQGSLLQFKDKNNKVRIQIGQDTTGNYTFILYDSTGKGVLINQDGIQSSDAIKDGLIVDSKVADNANISGSKLDISSLYEAMNEDGSSTLKASKVLLDDKGQTLEVSFKEMTTKQDEFEDTMNTAITDIEVSQGKIEALVQETTITNSDGTTTSLKDSFAKLQLTQEGFSTTVGGITSKIDSIEKEIGELELNNGFTVMLTNENHSFPASSNGTINVATTVTTQVIAYQGTTKLTPTIGTLPSVSGLTLTKSGDTITIQANTGTSLADSGSFNIPITVNGQNFTRAFSWTKVKSGAEAQYVVVNGEQVFRYSDNFSGTPTPSSITLTASKFNISANGKWQYKNTSGSWTDWTVSGVVQTGTTLTVSPTSGTLSSGKSMSVRYIVGSVYDEITIVKVSDGRDGTTIVDIKEQYYLSTSQQTLINGSWLDDAPTWEKGKFIWTRTVFSYNNGTTSTTAAICVTGKDGADGLNGGVSVSDVDVFYYKSTSATQLVGGSWQTETPSWENGKYIWSKTITYLDNGNQIESTPVCLTGQKGNDGIDGADGVSTYFYVRYSKNADGSNMTSVPSSDSKYMGVCSTTKTTAPTAASEYTWTLVKGQDGQNGSPGAKGENGKTSYLHIKYSDNGTSFTSNNGETIGKYIGTYVDFVQADSNNFNDYTWKKFVGEDGQDGANGQDAYTVVLTNETHAFPAESNGNIPSAITTSTQILAYKGATSVTPTIGNLPSVSGLTLSKSGSTVNIQANSGTSLADSGSFNIPITIDGKSFTKTFSWTKAKKGSNGAAGSSAKSADIVTSSQIFKSSDGGKTFSPNNITLSAILQNVTFSRWQYSTNGGSSWTNVTSGSNGLTVNGSSLTIANNSNLFSTTVTALSFKLITSESSIYDTVTIAKLYDVGDIEIGTRNMVKNSAFLMGDKYWNLASGSSIDTTRTLNGHPSLKMSQTGNTSNVWRGAQQHLREKDGTTNIPFYSGETITFSCWYFCADSSILDNGFSLELKGRKAGNTSDSGMASVGENSSTVVTGKWKRIEKTVTLANDYDYAYIYPFIVKNGTIWVTDIMVVRGSKMPEDWSPAPEDGTIYTDGLVDELREIDLKKIIEQNSQNATLIDKIFDDNIVTAKEKSDLFYEFERVKLLKDTATRYYTSVNDTSMSSLKSAMDTAYNNLNTTLSPVLSDMSSDSKVSNSGIKASFQTFYEAYENLMTALQNAVAIVQVEHATEIKQLKEDITLTASKTNVMVDKVEKFDAHMKFSADGFVEIYATKNGVKGAFSTQITDQKLAFKQDNIEIAYISNKELNITQAVIQNQLRISNFDIKPSGTSNGGIVFVYNK